MLDKMLRSGFQKVENNPVDNSHLQHKASDVLLHSCLRPPLFDEDTVAPCRV